MRLLALITALLLNLTLVAQSAGTLELNGYTTFKKGALRNVIVEVYKDGQPYTETQTNFKGAFELSLEGEGNYILRFMKDGYSDRHMLFNTNIEKHGYRYEKYEFELELFKSKAELAKQSQEIPVIEYDPRKRNFHYAEMM